MRIIILLGPPGSGKGTQAELLAERLGLYYLETAKIGEAAINKAKRGDFVQIKGKKYFFEKEKENWKRGALWSPPFVAYLMRQKIKELYKMGEGLVIAGSPRTLYEGKELMPFFEKFYGKKNIKVIFIDIPAKETIFRNSHRRICELMRHPILYSKETEKLKICPLDGSKLTRRKGLDDPTTIKVRLEEYKKKTFPLVQYFREKGFGVKEINGVGSVAAVFERILKALK